MLLLGGWAFELSTDAEGLARSESLEALERWVDNGLGYRLGEGGGRLFDPVEVINFLKWLGLAGEDSFWAERYVRTGRRLVESLRDTPARVLFEHRRSFDLGRFDFGSPVRLRLPLPVPGAAENRFTAEPVIPDYPGVSVGVTDARLEVRLPAPATPGVTIGANVVVFAESDAQKPPALTAAERNLYLRTNEGLIRVSGGVRALAQELAAVEPQLTVGRLWRYMIDELACGMVRYVELDRTDPLDFVLREGWYDCRLGSALLAALCRAVGIPARMVGGYLLYPKAPTNHYWVEIWLDDRGWTPYDFLNWDLSEAGRDAQWRSVFAGSLDQRLINERLPLMFTGSMSISFPDAWQVIQTRSGLGIEIAYTDANDGSLIYRDNVTVQILDRV